MKKILTIALTATFLSAPALAADEFGSRFGNSSPYALDNGLGDAIDDTVGFDMNDINDLNAIAPASGDEDTVESDDNDQDEIEEEGSTSDDGDEDDTEKDEQDSEEDDSAEDEEENDD